MYLKQPIVSAVRMMTLGLMAAVGVAAIAAAQAPASEDQSRQIVAEEFVSKRPAGSTKTAAKARYKPAKGSKAVVGGEARLGLTIWRLRPAAGQTDGARLLVQDGGNETSWVAERVDADAPLDVGDRVRLSFESARAGFLYVIDREQYADGTASDPFLIFPTSRTRAGDNRVEAGRLIEVPDQADRPNYFSVRRSRPDQVAEALTVIVAPTPIEGLTASSGARKLAAADVARWEKDWGGAVEQFALDGGAAKPWTTPEQRAGADGSRLLTQDDPPPQTVFRLKAAPGNPVLVTVRLPYGAGATRP